MHGDPMQTGQPNGVRSSDWLDDIKNQGSVLLFGFAQSKHFYNTPG